MLESSQSIPTPSKLKYSVHSSFLQRRMILKGRACSRPLRDQELCESRGDRPGLPVPNRPYGLCGRKATLNSNTHRAELRSCMKVKVAVLGSPSLIVRTVSLSVKKH